MQHARDRAVRAGADVGRGAGDRAGDADAAEQTASDVGDALRHQLAVRAVPPPASCRRRRRPRAATRSRRAARMATASGSTAAHLSQARMRGSDGSGKRARHAAEARADGRDVEIEQRGQRRPPAATAISMPGQFGRKRRTPTMMAMASTATRDRRGLMVRDAPRQIATASAAARPARFGSVEAEQLLDLAREDDDGDAGGEADRDRDRGCT